MIDCSGEAGVRSEYEIGSVVLILVGFNQLAGSGVAWLTRLRSGPLLDMAEPIADWELSFGAMASELFFVGDLVEVYLWSSVMIVGVVN